MSHKIAPNLLDFSSHQSVTVLVKPWGTGMDRAITNQAIKACLTEIHSRLSEATQIAKAAEACAIAGSVTEVVTVSMEIEQLIYEAGRLHDAASLLSRPSQT
jgi:hypothetical protein